MQNNSFPGINVPPPDFKKVQKIVSLVIVVFFLLTAFLSSYFTVNPEEVGVVMRFGAYKRTVKPGLHFKIPYVETVSLVEVERQLKAEFGFRTRQAAKRTNYDNSSRYDDESLMLTGDLNLANVEWVVQYRINDPSSYLFKIRDPNGTLKDMAEASMRQVVGNRVVNEVLTVGRQEIASKVEELLQQMCNDYETGIKIEQIVLQDVNPPNPVKPSFNKVNEAQQEKEKKINEAQSSYNKVIPKAKGQAQETIQRAEGYALERVNNAKGSVAKFNALYDEYVKAPEITKKRIYLETMSKVLPKLGQKIIIDEKNSNLLPLLQLNTNKGGK